MQVKIDIPEAEIYEASKEIVAKAVADRLLGEYYTSEKYCYRKVIKEIVRDVIKEDKESLENRAVAAASASIENKAIKKLMAQLTGDK